MASKYGRKRYYVVKTHPGRRVISKHYKLSAAKKAVKGTSHRVYDQDGRAFY